MDARHPHLITLVAMTALSVLTLNMFLPALPAMQAHFGVSEAVIGLAISAYMAAAALLQLVLGPLSDRIGRRPVVIGIMVVFILASILCLVAQSVWLFLVGRVVQAFAVGGGIIASAIVRDIFDGRVAAAKLATISSAMAIAPMLAPMLGGFLDAAFGWQAIFVLYVVLGLALFLAILFDLNETRIDVAPSDRPRLGALLGQRLFWAYAFCQSFGVGTFFIFLTGAPFVATAQFGMSSAEIGIGLGSITGGFMAGAAFSARFVARIGQARLILVGRAVALSGLFLGAVAFSWVNVPGWGLFAATIWVGIGNGLTLPNANAGALSVVPRLSGTAAGYVGALALVLGAALTSLTTAILSGQAGALTLLSLMIASMGISTIAALTALRWDRIRYDA